MWPLRQPKIGSLDRSLGSLLKTNWPRTTSENEVRGLGSILLLGLGKNKLEKIVSMSYQALFIFSGGFVLNVSKKHYNSGT